MLLSLVGLAYWRYDGGVSPFIPIRCSEIMYNNLNRTSLGWAYLHP